MLEYEGALIVGFDVDYDTRMTSFDMGVSMLKVSDAHSEVNVTEKEVIADAYGEIESGSLATILQL